MPRRAPGHSCDSDRSGGGISRTPAPIRDTEPQKVNARTRWSRLTGTGTQWNNHYASIYLGPDGTLYVATLAGLVRMKDSS